MYSLFTKFIDEWLTTLSPECGSKIGHWTWAPAKKPTNSKNLFLQIGFNANLVFAKQPQHDAFYVRRKIKQQKLHLHKSSFVCLRTRAWHAYNHCDPVRNLAHLISTIRSTDRFQCRLVHCATDHIHRHSQAYDRIPIQNARCIHFKMIVKVALYN